MIVAAHQLNYLPWLGFFLKQNLAGHFILADDVQFTKHGFSNRVKIKTATGAKWLTVPVLTKGKGFQKIKDVRIDNARNWQHKHWKTLYVNYKNAEFFEKYADFFYLVFQKNWEYLSDLNTHLIEFIHDELNIPGQLNISSKILSTKEDDATVHIINMVKSVNGHTYISGQSGKKYLKEDLFKNSGINLQYIFFDHPSYRQQFSDFIPNLSILDLLFNEGPNSEEILKNIQVKIEKHQK